MSNCLVGFLQEIMKILTVHIEDELDQELTKGSKFLDSSKSAFIRNAIRMKLERDVYGIESIPTLRSIRHSIVPNKESNDSIDEALHNPNISIQEKLAALKAKNSAGRSQTVTVPVDRAAWPRAGSLVLFTRSASWIGFGEIWHRTNAERYWKS